MSLDTIFVPTRTAPDMVRKMRKELKRAMPADTQKEVRRASMEMCKEFGAIHMRHPDWSPAEVAYAATEASCEHSFKKRAQVRSMFLEAARAVFGQDFDRGFQGVMVIFENTTMPLAELGTCHAYVLRQYAVAWEMMIGGRGMSDRESRVTMAIKLGNARMPDERGARAVISNPTRQQAAATFRQHVMAGGSPHVFL